MKLPQVQEAQRYTGLYVVDFGDHCGVGFRAEEVAELLDSEAFSHVTVYRVHNAYPDGRMELVGVRRETFHLEQGMFFYASEESQGRDDFQRLLAWARSHPAPSRAKVHLARYEDGRCVTALIYPAEYDPQFAQWLLDADYVTQGAAEGGVEAVQRYYRQGPTVLAREQLYPAGAVRPMTGQELVEATRKAVVR